MSRKVVPLPGPPPPEPTVVALERVITLTAALNRALLDVCAALRHDWEQAQAQAPADGPHYYTLVEAAARLGVDPETLRAKVAAGEIPAWRSGRLCRISAATLHALDQRA